MSDDTKYIKNLISEGEHQQLDFKFEITNARKIAKTLVAFANTEGGRLLIGVKDNGRISGIRSDEEYYMIDAAASMYCKPEISFESIRRSVDGKTILEIIIQPSELKPHFAQDDLKRWIAYHRVKDNNYLADYILLGVWKREKRVSGTFIEYSVNEKNVLKIFREKGPMDFKTLRNYILLKSRELQKILINLISLQAVSVEFHDNIIKYGIRSEE